MSRKEHREGGKYTGNHTTLIPVAEIACDIAHVLPQVTKISIGFITAGNSSGHSHKRVKFTDEGRSCILLKVRDNASHQEIRIYVTDIQTARTAIARKLRDADISICFTKELG